MRFLLPLPVLLLLLLLLLALAAPPGLADTLLITEVVTDPQADHSESAGGNGTPYDLLPGTGTVSSVDEYVEVYNAGTASIDLRGYRLSFQDSSPGEYLFGSGGVLRFSSGSALESLLPGGFVLLGNPPGALNNAIDLLLFDAADRFVDRLPVTDGNATSALDEAFVRGWNGTRFLERRYRDSITPLAPSHVAEPGALALLSVLAACGATLRRARRARGRRRSGKGPPRWGAA